MVYLHQSPLHSHGSLCSGHCLVDSRWTLKIAAYGLADFRQPCREEELPPYDLAREELWTAPELLRMPADTRPLYGTQKGDVYSFAIIVQEVVYRAQPFFGDDNPVGEPLGIR